MSRGATRVLLLSGAIATALLFYAVSRRRSADTPPSSGQHPPATTQPLPKDLAPKPAPGADQRAVAVPSADARGFVTLEPGFKVRKDKLPLVEAARQEILLAQRGVAMAAAELLLIARTRGIALDPTHPLATLAAAAAKLRTTNVEEAGRIESLIGELHQYDSMKPAGFPFAVFASPSTVIGLLDSFSGSSNLIERTFWLTFLTREIAIAPILAFDTDAGDGSTIVEHSYYGTLIAKFENWMAQPGPLKGIAINLLTARLSKSCEGYGELAARLGESVLNDLASGDTDGARAGASFLRSHLTAELRVRILSRFLEAKGDVEFTRLAAAMPIRPNGEEASLLGNRLLSSDVALQRTILSLMADRWGALARLGDGDPKVREVLDRVEKAVLASPETFGTSGVRYLIARLQTTSPQESGTEAYVGGLRAATASLTDERSRLEVVSYLSGLHVSQAPSIVATLALAKADQAALASGAVLVKLLCEDGIATADEALAGVLGAGSPQLLSSAFNSLQVRGALPKDATKTLAAIRQIAQDSSRPAEIQRMAQDYLGKTSR
jgi:hypothetical protein